MPLYSGYGWSSGNCIYTSISFGWRKTIDQQLRADKFFLPVSGNLEISRNIWNTRDNSCTSIPYESQLKNVKLKTWQKLGKMTPNPTLRGIEGGIIFLCSTVFWHQLFWDLSIKTLLLHIPYIICSSKATNYPKQC